MLLFVGILQVKRGLALAADARAGSIGPDGTDIAPVGDEFELSVLANQQRMGVTGVDGEAAGRGKVTPGLDFKAGQAFVVEDFACDGVAV